MSKDGKVRRQRDPAPMERARQTIRALRMRVGELEGMAIAAECQAGEVQILLHEALGGDPLYVTLESPVDLATRVRDAARDALPPEEAAALRNRVAQLRAEYDRLAPLEHGIEGLLGNCNGGGLDEVLAVARERDALQVEVNALRANARAEQKGILALRSECCAGEDETLGDFVRRLYGIACRPQFTAEEADRLRKCLGDDLRDHGLVGAVERLFEAWNTEGCGRLALAARLADVRQALAPPEECADADLAAYARATRETMETAIRREAEAQPRRPTLAEALLLVAAEIGRGTLGPDAALEVRAPRKEG
jgi:hypothetical protein